ncbi:MAG: hypothetical protein H0V88_03575 [Pyrinomonadaceae bacterium]|nr:hypothetical protein [Pyrinomonadaceae bacterium]
MKISFTAFTLILITLIFAAAQNTAPTQTTQQQPTRAQTPTQTRSAATDSTALQLADYGVQIEAEPRLIVVMAALEAAGYEAVPVGKQPSVFRQTVRSNASSIDENLRGRLRKFYEEHKLPAPATPAEQAARYVSLALALGAAPTFDLPARTDDLPPGVLEVLDFTTLVREFYRAAGGEQTLAAYMKAYNAEAANLRPPAAQMVRDTAAYLRTRPVLSVIERVPVSSSTNSAGRSGNSNRNASQQRYTTRERARRFHLVPDLLAAPAAINFRIIADDYYAIVPPGANLASSELRRAYLQFLVDPLVARFSREIALRRPDLRTLLDALPQSSTNANAASASDVFTSVARSLVVASDVRITENARTQLIAREADRQLQASGTDTARRARIVKEAQEARLRITDESTLHLAEAYERGAVLAFYFAEQLRGVETSGFDVANSLADMITSFDAARERNRLSESATTRSRAAAEIARRRATEAEVGNANSSGEGEDSRHVQLIKSLGEVDELLRARNYTEADRRLRPLIAEFQGEPRIFFALAQAASLSAQDATDATVQAERLGRALANYRLTVNAASPDTDKALLSRAHAAAGRILAFLERTDEAAQEFDHAIKLGDIPGGAYADAIAGRKSLSGQR